MVYIPKTDDFLKILTDKEVIHYQSFIRKKNRKSVKQSETNTYQPKTFENLKIDDIKSVITEDPKNLHTFSKTIRKDEKVGSNTSLYSDTKKLKLFKRKKSKNNKTKTCFWRFCKFL